jgi:hypothetical protein
MSLIGRFIDQLLPVGSITLVQPDGSRETHGPGGGRQITVKLHDRRAALELFRNPRLKIGELYMDQRLTVEDGSILDLLELVVGAKPWEQGRRKALGKGKAGKLKTLFAATPSGSPAATSRTITTSGMTFTRSSWTTTCSTAALTSPTPRIAWSRRRPTRRRISPPSST